MVKRIENKIEKCKSEKFLRNIWRECFGDPAAYENFYFKNVYPKNIVYAIEDKGMLHLNPYLCRINKEERILHYIVGVGTHFSQRRKGLMRRLLKRALDDMYHAGEPFTYLMPADVGYYQPFSFVSISDKEETIWQNGKPDNNLVDTATCENEREQVQKIKDVQFVEYKQLIEQLIVSKRQQLYDKIQNMLEEHHIIYAKHDSDYFKLLVQEKGCQNGEVIFCFQTGIETDNLLGFFAYNMKGNEMYVEQSVFSEDAGPDFIKRFVIDYKRVVEKVTVVEQFPFMTRIVNLEECIRLFDQNFYSYAAQKKRILVTDEILSHNNGIYSFSLENNHVCASRQDIEVVCRENRQEKSLWDLSMSIEELTSLLFCETAQNKVFFAEIV